MSLRINLLKENEYRYQGPVSLRFTILVSSALVGLILLVVLGLAAQRSMALRRNLRDARAEWTRIEPQFNKVSDLQKSLGANDALIGELALWSKTRPSWSKLLPALQQVVPESVQFTRLNARSEWQFLKPPAPPAGSGAEAGAKSKAQATELPNIPARKAFVSVEGRARGDLADETVVQLVRTWREADEYRPLFESVKLQRLLRENVQGKEQPDRLFEIQGEFFLRRLE
jgi:hypothetical protein